MTSGVLRYGDPLDLGYRLGDFPVAEDGVDCRMLEYKDGDQTVFTMNYVVGLNEDEMRDFMLRGARRIIAEQYG